MKAERNTASTGWAAVRLARQVELALATCDVSVSQFRVLTQLAQGDEASSSLARKTAVTSSTVSMVVDGLVQRGAVGRTHSAEDRRLVYLALTEAGEDLLALADRAVQTRLESIASELDHEAQQAEAFRGLARWGEALDRSRSQRIGDATRRRRGGRARRAAAVAPEPNAPAFGTGVVRPSTSAPTKFLSR